MRFKKFGKTLLMTALSAGVVFGVTSCIQSYTVGFLYVTGTNSATTSGDNGIISGFKIDHNKGKLTPINGLPISSGGSNPVRAVLLSGSKFVYVLNQGTNADGTACTTTDPCSGSNVTLFAVGGNGVLSPQGKSYPTQGKNPMRMFTDSTGAYLFVLDHDSPDNYATTYNATTNGCTLALGAGAATCGDVTVFKIDSDTGRLSLVLNQQVNSANGSQLTYFPVPTNPIDFALVSGNLLTMYSDSTTGVDWVFPYTYGSGQLTSNSNGAQSLGIKAATAIVASSSYVYILDAETTTATVDGANTTSPSGILIWTAGTGGSLSLLSDGVIPGDPTLTNPNWLVLESKGGWAYVSYRGDTSSVGTGNQESGIAGWVIDKNTHRFTPAISGSPWGTGSGPACLLEDPSHQFFYTANASASTVTGRMLNVQAGTLSDLPGNANKAYALDGPATWCIVSGRTS